MRRCCSRTPLSVARPTLPVIDQDRPHGVIDESGGAWEAAAECTFWHRTELQQCRPASRVRDGRTKFESTKAERLNGEINNCGRAVDEDASPPERLVQRETHFSGAESGFNRPELEQTSSTTMALWRHSKTYESTASPLVSSPANEPCELFLRLRTDGQVLPHFGCADREAERTRVAPSHLPKDGSLRAQHRKRRAPRVAG